MTITSSLSQRIAGAIRQGDDDEATNATRKALEADVPPHLVYSQCVLPTLQEIGDRFERLEIFLPEMMMSARAAKAVIGILNPAIRADTDQDGVGNRVIIGTVTGDIHDIGKNMVATMLDVNGFEVIDLQTDVDAGAFLDAAQSEQADIIAMSCLLTTSLPYARDLITLLEEAGLRDTYKVMVGGGPVTEAWALEIGADGYGQDAADAVNVAKRLLGAP